MRRSRERHWRWDLEKEDGRGGAGGSGGRREEGRHPRCPVTGAQGPASRGIGLTGDPRLALQNLWGPSAPLGAGRIFPTQCWAGALRGWARQHRALPMPHPKPTHIPQFPAQAPAPANQARGQHLCQPPVARGIRGTERPEGIRDGGSCGHHRKRKEAGGGICWEAPGPTPCASHCHPGRLGGTRLGPRGNSGGHRAQRAQRAETGGPQCHSASSRGL